VRCPRCNRPATLLFTSYVCDYCDGLVQPDWLSGYIVYRGEADFSRPIYVFPTRTEAALYRQAYDWPLYPICEVHFEHPVQWRPAQGKLDGIRIAPRPFTLHRDHRFESVPYSAYIVHIPEANAAA